MHGWDPYNKLPLGSVIDEQHPLANGLVGCWLMNEGKGSGKVYDLTRNRNAGAITDVMWTASAKGWATDYNGTTAQVQFDSTTLINNTGTIVALINIDNYHGGNPVYTPLMSQERSGSAVNGLMFGPRGDTGKLSCYLKSALTWKNVQGATPVPLDSWHSVATTWSDNGTTPMTVYLNGVADGTGDVFTDALDVGRDAHIGFEDEVHNYFDGMTAYVYIWNRALSAAEIAQLYRQPYCFIRTPAPRPWWLYTADGVVNVTLTPSAIGMTGALGTPVPEVRQLLSAIAMTGGLEAPTPEVRKLVAALGLTVAPQTPSLTISSMIEVATIALALAQANPTISIQEIGQYLLTIGEDDLYL